MAEGGADRVLVRASEGERTERAAVHARDGVIRLELPDTAPLEMDPDALEHWLGENRDWRLLKTINEVEEGALTVVCKDGSIFPGNYSEEYQCVFYTILSTYKIEGYLQSGENDAAMCQVEPQGGVGLRL